MAKFHTVAIAATTLFALTTLGGCQLAQSGSSTYGGSGIGKKVSKPNRRVELSADSPQPITIIEDSATGGDRVETGLPVISEKPKHRKAEQKKSDKGKKSGRNASVNKERGKKVSRKKATPKYDRLPRKKRKVMARKAMKFDRIIRRYASANGVPYKLARAVVQVESGFRPNARGGVGEIGLMQLRKNTARGMGYRGSPRGLYNPETNIKFGMRYLGKAYRLGGKSTCGAILKYNAGHGAKRMNPVSQRYCNKVRKIIGG